MSDFLSQLRSAREAATPGPWVRSTDNVYIHTAGKPEAVVSLWGDMDYLLLLVNNAEKIERLIEAVAMLDICSCDNEDDYGWGGLCRRCQAQVALAALNGEWS